MHRNISSILMVSSVTLIKDIKNMLSRLNKLPTDQGFPANSEFYVFQEVIDQNDGPIKVDEYYDTGLREYK